MNNTDRNVKLCTPKQTDNDKIRLYIYDLNKQKHNANEEMTE